jgi:hypothetical protein
MRQDSVSQVVFSNPFLGIQIQFAGEKPTLPITYVADLLKQVGLYSDNKLYRTKDRPDDALRLLVGAKG